MQREVRGTAWQTHRPCKAHFRRMVLPPYIRYLAPYLEIEIGSNDPAKWTQIGIYGRCVCGEGLLIAHHVRGPGAHVTQLLVDRRVACLHEHTADAPHAPTNHVHAQHWKRPYTRPRPGRTGACTGTGTGTGGHGHGHRQRTFCTRSTAASRTNAVEPSRAAACTLSASSCSAVSLTVLSVAAVPRSLPPPATESGSVGPSLRGTPLPLSLTVP
jgi:hypothetical protein